MVCAGASLHKPRQLRFASQANVRLTLRAEERKMINEKTAFIIGAGGHVPYNMPTGKKLREQIISSSANHDYFNGLNIPGYNSGKYKDFCDSFKHSNIASIDRYLQLNPEYRLEGKIAILFCIKQNECTNYKSTLNDQWIQFLYNKMIEGIKSNTDYEQFNNNNVYFCTFNYDRLFDWAIYTSILNTFGTNPVIKQAYQKNGFDGLANIFKLKIDHVYGQIGKLNENPIDKDDYSLLKTTLMIFI